MFRVGYYVVSRNGLDRRQWLEMLEKSGVAVREDDDPVYSDIKPRKPTGGSVTFEQVPELRKAVASLRSGERLVIPHAGHLVSPTVWEEVAARLVAAGATLECVADETVLDGTDIEAGRRLLKSRAGRSLTDARARARVKMGRPKRALAGVRLEEALRLFPDPEWSADRLAERYGMGRMTFLRRIEEATGTMSKGEALELREAGKWPPKRKLK